MLARFKHGLLLGLVGFLSISGAVALPPEEAEVQTALLTPPSEVIYVTRSPLAGVEPRPQEKKSGAEVKDSHRVNNEPPTTKE